MAKKTGLPQQNRYYIPGSSEQATHLRSAPAEYILERKNDKHAQDKLENQSVTAASSAETVDMFSAKHFLPATAEERPTFNYSEILPLLQFLGYNQEESSELLETNASTISRWKNSDKPVDIGKLRSKVVLDIDEIITKGVRIFGDEEHFQEWLNASNYALGDVRPVDLLKNVYSIALVEDTLDALFWGNYL